MNTQKNALWTTVLCGVISLGVGQVAHAQLVNGGFENTSTTTPSTSLGNPGTGYPVGGDGAGQLGYNINATGWSIAAPSSPIAGYTTPYAFLFTPGSADGGGAESTYGNFGALNLWGPGSGGGGIANGLPATSPAGGNYVGLDADGYYQAVLSQNITGLTVGQTYALSFYWAGAQQTTFLGTTTDFLAASLGGQTFDTPTITVASQGFDPWTKVTFDYTASSTSEVLSFLATGTPLSPNIPPFVLLDGVSLTTTVPDSSSTAVLFIFTAASLFLIARRYSAIQFQLKNEVGR
jgi:hypothetical protein